MKTLSAKLELRAVSYDTTFTIEFKTTVDVETIHREYIERCLSDAEQVIRQKVGYVLTRTGDIQWEVHD